MTYFFNYHAHTGSNPEKFFKSTFFQTPRLLLGLNCLEPGQVQTVHEHDDQDKFYYVIEGEGEFSVANEKGLAGAGMVVYAPAGIEHGVTNTGNQRLVLLVGIAPAPGK